MQYRNKITALFVLIAILAILPWKIASAQESSERRPIDMMLVIDNSCSMFPRSQIAAGCESYGSDPDFLRIKGADVFIARLGFGEQNEAEYQLGIISMGKTANLISELQPLLDKRDELAKQIANPQAQTATQLILALQEAYNQMRTSPNRDTSHLPAVVLITDGVPYPPEGQANSDIIQLISQNSDIPLFIMLLQEKTDLSTDYQSYIQFWEQLQTRFSYIYVYKIDGAEQIETTYNAILGQLQGTIATDSENLTTGMSTTFSVGRYVRRIIITVIQKSSTTRGEIQIVDPNGDAIIEGDEGVSIFKGQDNPVEVYSIGEPRLSDELRDKTWTLSSTADITFFIDREGGYTFNFLTPETTVTDLDDVFQLVESQSPSQVLTIRFNLVDADGIPVLEPQSIWGQVFDADGDGQALSFVENPQPDAEGTYEINFDLTKIDPDIVDRAGRFLFILNAGMPDTDSTSQVPVTIARLLVDAGRMPYIRSIAPTTLTCSTNLVSTLRVAVGDYDIAVPDTLNVQVIAGSQIIDLEQTEDGVFTTDLTGLCAQFLAQQACSVTKNESMTVRMEYKIAENEDLAVPVTRLLSVDVIPVDCTPTPIPSPTALPTPSPTPAPDSDRDGLNNLEDQCPNIPGFKSQDGCIPTNWFLVGLGGLGILLVSSKWGWPWVKVHTFANPPDGYFTVNREGLPPEGPYSFHQIGMRRITDRIRIGGSRGKADFTIHGLRSVEFIVERKSTVNSVREPNVREPFIYLSDEVQVIRTSDPKIILKVSLDRERLE